jgi:hypothetical protein
MNDVLAFCKKCEGYCAETDRLTFLYHRLGIIIREYVVTCCDLLWILQLVLLLAHMDEMRYADILLVGTSEYF